MDKKKSRGPRAEGRGVGGGAAFAAAARVSAWIGRAVLGLLLLLAAVAVMLNTGSGQRLLAWGLGKASGGQILVEGLSGTLPLRPRIARLELRDADGLWLAIDEAALDIAPRALLGGTLEAESLSARTLTLARLPSDDGEDSGPWRLPLPVRLDRVAVERLDLSGWLPGAPPLALDGRAAGRGLADLEAELTLTAPGRPDRYRLELAAADGVYRLNADLRESPGGAVAALAAASGVHAPPELRDWRLTGSAQGPWQDIALALLLDAGPLQAKADGHLDLETLTATGLKVAAELPAMALTPAGLPPIAWRRIGLSADLDGPWSAPRGRARLESEGLAVRDWSLARLTADLDGDRARLRLGGELCGLAGPRPLPPSAATVPLRIVGELALAEPARPARLTLSHPLLDLAAHGELTARSGEATLSLPDLAALGAMLGQRLAGRARLELSGAAAEAPRLRAQAELALTQAPGPTLALLGPAARLTLAVQSEGRGTWRIDQARLDAAQLGATVAGLAASESLALGWTLELRDLAALAPGWSGPVRAHGGLAGRAASPELLGALDLEPSWSGPGSRTAPLAGRLAGRFAAQPAEPSGALDLAGNWAGQPASLHLRADRAPDGAMSLAIGDTRLAGFSASGRLRFAPGAALPEGELRLRIDRLADLAPLLPPRVAGPGLAGTLDVRLALDRQRIEASAEGRGLTIADTLAIGSLALNGRVSDPLGRADTDATLRLDGLSAGRLGGGLTLAARGPAAALDLSADAALATPAGPADLQLGARLDAPARRLALQRLEARAQGKPLRLLAPATLDLKDGLAVDRLRLSLGNGKSPGTLELAGRLSPRLDASLEAARLPLDLLRLVPNVPPLAGTLGARLRLTGTADTPTGSVQAQIEGLRLVEGAGRAMPPAELRLTATLGRAATELDARAQVPGRADLRLRGRIAGPLANPGTLSLRADGRADLALLDPLLAGGGRQLHGQATLDTAIAGTLAAPRLSGSLDLADGTLRDRTLGLSLSAIQGRVRLAGDTLSVERLTAQAGRGTLSLQGRIGVLAPGIPVDLRLEARNARPIQRDLVEIQGDADLRLAGQATGRLELSGRTRFSRVDIRLPDRLPPEIATLEVRERGRRTHPLPAQPARASAGPLDLGLDLGVAAPRAVYVRGQGVDAELGGEVQIRGTLAQPSLSGGFNLLRGDYKLVGQTLRFTSGRIGFDGAAGFNANLDLEARVAAAGSTAILAVLGTVKSPRIVLRSEPELPQDEVLSRLLFGAASGRLSAVQAARLGIAAASLAGIGKGEGFGVLERARTGLGLDRLSVDTDEKGGAMLEGGRYLSEGVYLGARQGSRSGETQGVLRIEVTPQVRLEADVGGTGGTRGGAAFEVEY